MTPPSPLADQVVVVTGGGSGIGAALAQRSVADGARAVVVTDRDEVAARRVADTIGMPAAARRLDVGDPDAVAELVLQVLDDHGRIDVLFSNAGITTGVGVLGDDVLGRWEAAWSINVMSHVYLARAVLPTMVAAGGGRFVITASAAGLLTTPGDAAYTVTKHGAVALAEWLAVHYGTAGIDVSVLCPLGVATPLLLDPLQAGDPMAAAVAASGEIIDAEVVAEAVVTALAARRFLILPHPEVARFWQQKAGDPDRWLAGVRRLVGTSAPDATP